MAEYLTNDTDLGAVADAIRAKGGTSAPLEFPNGFVDAIEDIPTGTDTSDATAVASDILSGKTAYIATGKVTGTIASKSSSDLTASGDTVSVPAGYYASAVSKAVAAGTEGTPTNVVSPVSNHSVIISPRVTNTEGYIPGTQKVGNNTTIFASDLVSGNLPITSNGTNIDVTNYETVSVNVSGIDTSDATAVASDILGGKTAYIATGKVTGTIPEKDSTDLTASGDTVTVPAGHYASAASKAVAAGSITNVGASKGRVTDHSINVQPYVNIVGGYLPSGQTSGNAATVTASELVSGTKVITSNGTTDVTNYAEATVSAGVEGTPVANKGSVSNHSINVTPTVTNVAGWINGSTKLGTPVSVTASELVSGDLSITSNGTNIDVTNYETVSVNVSGKNVQIAPGVNRIGKTQYTQVTDQSITVAKTGTYDVYWVGYRTSTTGASGTQLYINGSAYGSAQTTFSTNAQAIHLSNVSLTENQVVSIYARSPNTTTYTYAGNLTIIEA